MIKCIIKYFKRRRLLKKYKSSCIMGEKDSSFYFAIFEDPNYMKYYFFKKDCELRCYNRLLKLKTK